MGILCNLLKYGQPMLVYPSGFLDEPEEVDTPDMYSMPYEDVFLMTEDRIRLHCYLIRPEGLSDQASRGTVLMCHGNAMNHGAVLGEAHSLFKTGFNVFTLEYRGYGNNKGRPSEKGLQLDAQAALEYISSHPILGNNRIVVFGQSLGGAVAIDVTSHNPSKVTALIVENTFTSIPNIVKGFPILCHFSFLCTQRWNSQAKIRRLPASLPILLLSGMLDEVVPPMHMETLWKEAKERCSNYKQEDTERLSDTPTDEDLALLVKFPTGAHNTTCHQRGYQRAVQKFMDCYAPRP